MGKYKYTGVKDGRKFSGEVDADSINEVKRYLRRIGVRKPNISAPSPLDIDLGLWAVEKGLAKPFKHEELMRFTRQLSTLINAGVPILESLEMLKGQERNLFFRKVLEGVTSSVEGGKSMYEALVASKQFDRLYCNLIKAGEAAGILDTILVKIAEYMEKQDKLKKQVKGALTYPAIVVVIGLGVVWGLMTFVVPQFVSILVESGQEVPWVTQTVIDISDFFQKYTLMLVPGTVAAFIVFVNFIKTKNGKIAWDRFLMKSPLFGDLVIKGNLGSFTRTLATTLGAGVPIIDAIEICIETIDNSIIARDLKKVKQAVIEGKALIDPLQRIRYFPPLVAQMIKVGEATGNLDEMLTKVSKVFEEEISEAVANLTKLIEPLILVVLGGIIGFVLIAMYLPIFMSAGGAG